MLLWWLPIRDRRSMLSGEMATASPAIVVVVVQVRVAGVGEMAGMETGVGAEVACPSQSSMVKVTVEVEHAAVGG